MYFTVTTGASAKNNLIFLASSGFVENAMNAAGKEDISSHKFPVIFSSQITLMVAILKTKQNEIVSTIYGEEFLNFSKVAWALSVECKCACIESVEEESQSHSVAHVY